MFRPRQEPPCPVCAKPVGPHEPASFEHGEVLHLDCATIRKPAARVGAPPRPEPTPDPVCPICSKPIRPPQAIVSRDEPPVHLRCHVRQTMLHAMELNAQAGEAQQRATGLIEDAARLRDQLGKEPEPPHPR